MCCSEIVKIGDGVGNAAARVPVVANGVPFRTS